MVSMLIPSLIKFEININKIIISFLLLDEETLLGCNYKKLIIIIIQVDLFFSLFFHKSIF
jgi:hypothetical protein